MTIYSRQNPSPTFRRLEQIYQEVHSSGFESCGLDSAQTFDGASLHAHIHSIRDIIEETGARSILDFGSGKGQPYKERNFKLPDGATILSVREFWGVDSIALYDPGVPEYSQYPSGTFDGVISTDVLEHIPEDDIPWMLKSFFDLSTHFIYANIASYPARKVLPNGWNAHVTVKPPSWWREHISEAARGWNGKRYVFKVLERSTGWRGRLRKLTGGSKWRETSIEG